MSDGAELLDLVRRAVRRYVILPSEHAEVGVTLWIATTHAAPVLHHAPRLAIRSPEKRCGKSRLLDVVGTLCRAPLWTVNASTAAMYRVMGGRYPRTLLLDEADAIWGTKKAAENYEDLRALVNAGFDRGRPVLRYDAAARAVEELDTFGFVALAAIRTLPDTITDRAVNLTMRRRRKGETVEPFRARRDGDRLQDLRDALSAWVEDNLDTLEAATPDLPVEDRAADVWESLVAVADLAGGGWPASGRDAAKVLTAEQDQEEAASMDSVRLLKDVRSVFRDAARPFLPSRELTASLRAIDDAPWSETDLTVVKLAGLLQPYKISPGRAPGGKVRGYALSQFLDAFERYLTETDDDE